MKFRNIFILTIFLSVILMTTGCGKKDTSLAAMSDKQLEKMLIGEWVQTFNKGTDDELVFVYNFEKKGKLSMKAYYMDEGNPVFENLSGTWKCLRKDVSPYAEKIASDCGVKWVKDKFPYLKVSFRNDTRKYQDDEDSFCFIVDNGKKGKDYRVMLCDMDTDMDEYVFDQKNPDSDDADELPHYFYGFENECDEKTALMKEKYNSKGAKEISYERLETIWLQEAATGSIGSWKYSTWGYQDEWFLLADKTFTHSYGDLWGTKNESGTWDIKKQTFTDKFGVYYITFYKNDNPYKCLLMLNSGKSGKTIDVEYATEESFDEDFIDDEIFKHTY